jgi:hypothetical protein
MITKSRDSEVPMHIQSGTLVCAVLLAGAALAQPSTPSSEDATGLVLRSTAGEFSGRAPAQSEPIAEVRPGETVTITGDCVRAPSADNLRVVLTLSESATGASAGYRAVMATDQRIRDGNLQVRVPDMPEADNQVFQIKVFRLGEQAPQICEAGAIRIDAGPDGRVG